MLRWDTVRQRDTYLHPVAEVQEWGLKMSTQCFEEVTCAWADLAIPIAGEGNSWRGLFCPLFTGLYKGRVTNF